MFASIIDAQTGLTAKTALICTAASLILGLAAALLYRLNNKRASKNLLVSLVVLPALVQAVIMLVNGSIGAGIAVMGAFNLVRFRSTPGSSRDICYIFYAMAIGLATGMGYISFAVLLTIVVGVVLAVLSYIPLFSAKDNTRLLRIVIPEDMDYTDCFKDIFDEYLSSAKLLRAKTSSMGTLYDLRYEVVLKNAAKEKEMLDKIRVRNGNLTVACGLPINDKDEL